MVSEIYVTILVIALVISLIGMRVYTALRDKTLEEIRMDVYDLFLMAEDTFTKSKMGKQKMDWVIWKARSLLPKWARLFISEELLRKMVQMWFDAIKDVLDDGEYNHSTEKQDVATENEEQSEEEEQEEE